ncbi:MAG TPA: GNAT family N-acetyltransferase [Nocardioidaceae bacterium]
MDIREIDRHDEELTHRFWEIGRAADEEGRPWSSYWSWPAARAAFSADDAPLGKVLLGAFDGDTMVGAAEVSLPRLDNTHMAAVEVYVDPPHQRRGIGTVLVEAATRVAEQRGRSALFTEVATPLEGPESPGLRLAGRMGFRTEVVDDMKVADLEETEHLWAPLLEETEPHAAGYTLRSWRDVCPADLVQGYCTLLESFNTESPTGELELEPEHWDEQRLREKEERFRRGGRHETTTVALAADGEVVGMTEVMVSDHAPDRGFQGATLVAPAHRGHRLGLRLKATNHRLVRESFPQCRTLLTGNADVNAAMNAVNERLGYRAVERYHEMQKRLD